MHDMHTLARQIGNPPYLLAMTIGIQIRHFRKKQGVTQAELAKKVGVKQYSITRWEKGHNSPTPEVLAKIAQALKVAVGDLYEVNGKDVAAERKGEGSRREAQIQKIFRELPPADQRALLKQAKGLIKGK